MQFETKVINGKPSIFYKDDLKASETKFMTKDSKVEAIKKLTTRDDRNKRAIRKTLRIPGEVDQVKVSPREAKKQQSSNNQQNSLLQNLGANLTEDQLKQIMSIIQNKTTSNNNDNSMNFSSRSQELDLANYQPARVVVYNDQGSKSNSLEHLNIDTNPSSKKMLPSDRKKLKWQQDRELLDQLAKQEVYDTEKFRAALESSANNNANHGRNRTGMTPEPGFFKSTLTLAERKRLEWQQEKDIDDQFRPSHHNDSSFAPMTENSLRKSMSMSNLNNMFPTETNMNKQYSSSHQQLYDPSIPQPTGDIKPRTSLIEQKRREWQQENEGHGNWPFGKPGPGAGPNKNRQQQINEMQQSVSNQPVLNKPPPGQNNKNNKNYVDKLKEYKALQDQLEAIAEAERKLKQEQAMESTRRAMNSRISYVEPPVAPPVYHDQTRLPAAMRTSIAFGEVMYDDEIKRTKELEKKKWLAELAEQKREKQMEQVNRAQQNEINSKISSILKNPEMRNSIEAPANPTSIHNSILAPSSFNNKPGGGMNRLDYDDQQSEFNSGSLNQEEKAFGRTRSLMDPAQIDEMERKRKLNLQHKMEIDAQIAEKNRIKSLEDEVTTLSQLKVDNEAKRMNTISQLSEQVKRQNPAYRNLDVVLNSNRYERSTIANVLHPDKDNNQVEQDNASTRGQASQNRAQEIYRKIKEAEVAAAEEKHKKTLKRLRRGGHDTSALEQKFAEYKAKVLGGFDSEPGNNSNKNQPNLNNLNINLGLLNSQLERNSDIYNANNNNNNNYVPSTRQMNNMSSMSMLSESEIRLNKEKNRLERQLMGLNGSFEDDGPKMRRILDILKEEDSNELPAELSEDQLRYLLKSVARNRSNDGNDQRKNQTTNGKAKTADTTKSVKKESLENTKKKPKSAGSDLGHDGENDEYAKYMAEKERRKQYKFGEKPIWGYRNMEGRKFVPNSVKDPFYNERAKLLEERRKRRAEYFAKYNNGQGKNDSSRSQMNTSKTDGGRASVSSMYSMSSSNAQSDFINGGGSKKSNGGGGESMLNLLTKNLARNTIYEEDENEGMNHHHHHQNQNHGQAFLTQQAPIRNPPPPPQQHQQPMSSNRSELENEFGFVPFMRTNEFLNPAHAGSPIPPSRESSAVKREREKARQAYYQSLKPADYGSAYQTSYSAMNEITNRGGRGGKDPLINNGLVKNSPTPRQEQILNQLATLKQSLMAKQREVASSLAYDNDYGLEN